jgi:alkylation response protein AidB-like acyl-CoA dehydrogenase
MPQVALRDDDGGLAMLRDSIAVFGKHNPGPPRLRVQRGRRRLDRAVWRSIAEAGWIGLQVPEKLGGPGLTAREQVVVSEALGAQLAPEPYAMLCVFAPAALCACPPSPQRDHLLAGAMSGERLVSVAWQARRGGHGASAKLDRVTGEWILDGETAFVEAANDATDLLVVASLADGIGLFALDPNALGVAIAPRAGVDGGVLSDVAFRGVRLPQSRKVALAPSLDAILGPAIAQTRLAIAAELAGLASKALEITIAYGSQRVQFGKPIASFQVIQHRLVDMWMQAELASASVRNAAELSAAGVAPNAANVAILAAKARASDAAAMICRHAVHLHGAMGYTDECDIGLYLKRAINLGALLGNADLMRRLFIENTPPR